MEIFAVRLDPRELAEQTGVVFDNIFAVRLDQNEIRALEQKGREHAVDP